MTDQMLIQPRKRNVNLRDIETRPEVFQFRHVEADPHHVSDLVDALQRAADLDPVALWQDPVSGALVVIDGHHRIAAYRKAGRKKVPARLHRCDHSKALLMALVENGKTRLPLTNDERQDAAWRLTCRGRGGNGAWVYSKQEVMAHCGTSDGTVAAMRRTWLKLTDGDPEAIMPENWKAALAELHGRERREPTPEEYALMTEARTRQLDEQFGKALGDAAQRWPEAAMAVVAERLGRQALRRMVEEYAHLIERETFRAIADDPDMWGDADFYPDRDDEELAPF